MFNSEVKQLKINCVNNYCKLLKMIHHVIGEAVSSVRNVVHKDKSCFIQLLRPMRITIYPAGCRFISGIQIRHVSVYLSNNQL